MNKKLFLILLVGSNWMIFAADVGQKEQGDLAKVLAQSAIDEEERLFRQALAESELLERSRKEVTAAVKPKEQVADKDLKRAMAESLAEFKKKVEVSVEDAEPEVELQPGAPVQPMRSGAVVVAQVAAVEPVVPVVAVAPVLEKKEEVAAKADIPAEPVEPEFKADVEEQRIMEASLLADLAEARKKLTEDQKRKRAACVAQVV